MNKINKNELEIINNASLAKYSYFRVGGLAKYLVNLTKAEHFVGLDKIISDLAVKRVFVIGAGSNLLISDRGFDGLVIKVDWTEWKYDQKKWMITAGVMLPVVSRDVIKAGFSGLEHLANIPGTVGGAIRGNAEAFRQSISDHLEKVIWIDFQKGEQVFTKKDCLFAYRDSIFKSKLSGQGIIKQAYFAFPPGDADYLSKIVVQDKVDRNQKQPNEPSCGCFFKNIELSSKVYDLILNNLGAEALQGRKVGDMYAAGRIIDWLGLKGMKKGGASISTLHANFIIGDATVKSQDIYDLYQQIKAIVKKRVGIVLEAEVQFCGDFI
ncbi:MAG: UDP-N-acetylmuramate dehydrogenase [Patescibacteria group bacterium]